MREDRERVETMTEMMMSDAGAGENAEMLDDVLSEPGHLEGVGAEGMETGVEGMEPENPEQGGRTVPLATFLGMRDEAKAMNAENAELRQIIAMMQQQGQLPPENDIPDPETDPLGYSQYMAMLENQAAQVEVQQAHEQLSQVEGSLDAAKSYLGENFIEAYETARANPEIARMVLMHPEPGAALVELHHQIQHMKFAGYSQPGVSQNSWGTPQAAYHQPQWGGAAPFHNTTIAAPPPSLAGARGGNASALVPLISDDPIDDLLK